MGRFVRYHPVTVTSTNGLPGRCLRNSFGIPSTPQAFLSFKGLINFCTLHDLTLSRGLSSTDSRRGWTLASTRRSWFSSHRSWGVKTFSKQSAVTLALSNGWNLRHEKPRIAAGVWSRSSSKCYLRIQSVPQREHHTSPLQRSTG
jgi:hypothetical protein